MTFKVDYSPSQDIVSQLEKIESELSHLAGCAKSLYGDGAVVFVIEDCAFWSPLVRHLSVDRKGHVEITREISTEGLFTGVGDWTISKIAVHKAPALDEATIADCPQNTVPLIVFDTDNRKPRIYPMHISLPTPSSAH
jgi:hypothetical protein